MWTFPILIDSRPSFFPPTCTASLLLAPLGDGTVLTHLRSRLRIVTGAAPVVVAPFGVDAGYEEAIRASCPEVEGVDTLADFVERSYSYEPSDWLLLADPACMPLDPNDPGLRRLAEDGDPRSVKHLVALERSGEGTKEYVDTDPSGRIRSIQRYYDSVTWSFATGVACSLLPVACLRVAYELPLTSLPRLRRVLASEGLPSHDVPLEHGAAHLGTEVGLLSLNQHLALSLVRGDPPRDDLRASPIRGSGVRVHPTATLAGPIVLQDEVEVGEGATVIGPSVLGPGSRVEARATITQCVVGMGEVVDEGASLRHQVFLGRAGEAVSGGRPQPEAAGTDGWETDPLGTLSEPPQSSLYPTLKRAFDATFAALTLALLSPLWLIVAALVKLESRGAIHFGHVREGMNGQVFRCWKFRTMIPDADQQQRKLAQLNQMDGPQFKVKRDPRRTRIGRFLSLTNLDEIPQLWNVLVGEMSLVGPRPSPFRENQVCVPWREGRLSVRPGITGLWQICRHDRDKGDFHQWIYYDLLYVRNMSFQLDAKIAALTLVSFARGGYIPLSWLLPPDKYGERRSRARRADAPRPAVPASGAASAPPSRDTLG